MTDETDETSTPASEQTSTPKAQARKPQAKQPAAAARCPICARRLNDGHCQHCGFEQRTG